MKGEIAVRTRRRQRVPSVERRRRFILRRRTNHLDDCRRSARECRARGAVMVVRSERSHEGKMDVHMRIDEPWEDQLARGIDDLGRARQRLRIDRRLDARDGLALGVDIGDALLVGGNDRSTTNQNWHEAASVRH